MPTLLIALLLVATTTSPSAGPVMDEGLKQVLEIDDEIAAIGRHSAFLARDRAARFDEIRSLKLRYPEISILPGATVADIVKALRALRAERARKAMPAMEARVREANDRYCKARASLLEKRAEMEASDDYKRLSLDERLALRKAIDDLIAANRLEGVDCDAR